MKKKNNIITIIKKELSRFFGDKRMFFTTVLLPGLIIYVLYSFMGNAVSGMFTTSQDYVPSVYVVNMSPTMDTLTANAGFDITRISEPGIDEAKQEITDKTADLLVVLPEDFDAAVAAYEPSQLTAPQVEIYYNGTKTESATTFATMQRLMDQYESSLANKFDVNTPVGDKDIYDVATEKDATGFMFSSMLPMLLLIFMYSGCMAVAPESISGEKERGTIATMLITPVKRSELAIGKITALAIIALLAGASSTLGTLLSLPKLMNGATEGMSAAFYTVSDYVWLAAVVLSTVLLFISIISVISAFAKTIKEAQTTVMPLMILVMVVGVTGMFGGGAKAELVYYLIPVYNSVQCMMGIFSFAADSVHIAITVVVNVLLSGVFVFVLTKMFNSEKIMFNK